MALRCAAGGKPCRAVTGLSSTPQRDYVTPASHYLDAICGAISSLWRAWLFPQQRARNHPSPGSEEPWGQVNGLLHFREMLHNVGGRMLTPTESETPHTATAGTTANSAPADGGADPATYAAAPLLIRTPERGDGAAMWTLARDGGELDVDYSYADVLIAKEYGDMCGVDLSDGEEGGFLVGYRPAERAESCLGWQVPVTGDQRGRSVAKRMLND